MGERLNGIQEVIGSIPIISTMKTSKSLDFEVFFFGLIRIKKTRTYAERSVIRVVRMVRLYFRF